MNKELSIKKIKRKDILNKKEIQKITNFYNKYFKQSTHSKIYKLKKYQDKKIKPLIIVIKYKEKIIGILESWTYKKNKKYRLLSTILIDKNYRNQGLAQKIWLKANKILDNENWLVHFRDSNKNVLKEFYKKLGFKKLKKIGNYKNGEIKWEMKKNNL